MASSLALKNLLSKSLYPNSFFVIRPLATASQSSLFSRLFNTNASRRLEDHSDDDERGVLDVMDRLPRRDNFLSDVFDPFSPTRSLSQVLNLMDQVMDTNPFFSSRGMGAGLRRSWHAKETEDALHLRVDMPGLGKEDVKVSVEHNTLVIKGEGGKESGEEESGRKYNSRIELPEKMYKTDEIKAEMKNGVMKVVVPKVKEEERADVLYVKVD